MWVLKMALVTVAFAAHLTILGCHSKVNGKPRKGFKHTKACSDLYFKKILSREVDGSSVEIAQL